MHLYLGNSFEVKAYLLFFKTNFVGVLMLPCGGLDYSFPSMVLIVQKCQPQREAVWSQYN